MFLGESVPFRIGVVAVAAQTGSPAGFDITWIQKAC